MINEIMNALDNAVNLPENIQKYKNYKEQFKRLDRVLKAGFNLEAVFYRIRKSVYART